MIKRIIDLIVDTTFNEDEVILRSLLKSLKNECNLEELTGDNYSRLLRTLSLVKDDSTKALLIETIVESPEYDKLIGLLEEYIQLISKGVTNTDDAARCLDSFSVSDYSDLEILTLIAENVEKELATKIIISGNLSLECEFPSHLESFQLHVKKARRIQHRSFIIGAFLLIVHPLCSKYATIGSLSFGYPYTEAAANDWGYNQKNVEIIIDRRIITPEEGKVLARLYDLLLTNRNVSTQEAEKLYADFFGSKDPFDVIYTLPED
ncbi:hypothetical protein D3C74_81330 [compost metagenome]